MRFDEEKSLKWGKVEKFSLKKFHKMIRIDLDENFTDINLHI